MKSTRSKGRFPDGGVEVNLRGYDLDDQRLDAEQALRLLLGALKLSAEGDTDALRAAWRAATEGKDMLVLLDNARDDALIDALMPGAGPTVLVTTREPGFAGSLELEPLTPKEASDLIAKLAPRIDATDYAEIAGLGFHLPLVIDVIAREVQRVSLPVSEALAPFRDLERLADTESRSRGERIAAIFGHSIHALPEPDRPDYAALSLFIGGFYEHVVAEVWDIPPEQARTRLADWEARGLVERAGDTDLGPRWRLHDLLSEAARRHLDTTKEAPTLRRRWVVAVLRLLETAQTVFDKDNLAGLSLFDRDRATIDAAQTYGAAHWQTEHEAGNPDMARALARFPNNSVLSLRLPPKTFLVWLDAALPAARAIGNRGSEALILGNIGWFAQLADDFSKARKALEGSITLKRKREDRFGEARSESNLGTLLRRQLEPDLDAAEKAYYRSSDIFEALHDSDDPFIQRQAMLASAQTYGNLGNLFSERDDYPASIDAYRKSLPLSDAVGDQQTSAGLHFNLADILLKTGALAEARSEAMTARDLFRALKLDADAEDAESLIDYIDSQS